MSAYHCAIRSCQSRLLGFAYFTLILDNDKRIAVCPSCFRKVNDARADHGMERLTGYRSVRMPDASSRTPVTDRAIVAVWQHRTSERLAG